MIEYYHKFRDRWVEFHPFLRLLIVLLVLALGAWFVGKPAYRVARYWWYGRHLANAEKAVNEGQMEKAKELSQTLLRGGDPRVLEALRILEKSLTALRDPMRVEIAKALMSHPEGSREDKIRGFRSLATGAPMGVAGQAWVFLGAEYQKTPECAFPFADRLIEDRLFAEAAGVIKGTSDWETGWEAQSRMIRMLILSGDEYAIVEAHNRLDKGWPKEGAAAALDILEMIPVDRLKPGLLPDTPARLDPKVPQEALLRARLDYAKDGLFPSGVVDQAVNDWKAAAPLELAKFLAGIGVRRRLMEEFPPAEAKVHPGMIGLLLEAAAREQDWEAAKSYLAESANQLDKVGQLAWKCAILDRTGDGPGADSAWREASVEADLLPDAEPWIRMAGIMKLAGLAGRVDESWLEAVVRGRGKLPLFQEMRPLMERLYAGGREKALMQVCVTYLPFEPGNPMLLTHYAYLACMAPGSEPDSLAKAMEPLASAHESLPHVQAVLAAIHLARGKVEEAKMVAGRVTVPVWSLPPGYGTAVVVARVLAGELDPNGPEVREIPWAKMMPVERRFYSALLKVKEPEAKPENAAE